MTRALTDLCGALAAFGLGIRARSLIKTVDPQARRLSNLVLAISCAFGLIVTDLVFLRFLQFQLQACYIILFLGLLVQSLIDGYTHRLVRQISHILGLSGLMLITFFAVTNSELTLLVPAGSCAILGAVVALGSNKISRGSLGAGDVRLMAVLGWHLGFIGYSSAIWALFAACIFASMFGLALVMFSSGSLKQRIAFGPFLALGTFVAVFSETISSYIFMA